MRNTLQRLLGFCLMALCIAASSSQRACAQSEQDTIPFLPKYIVLGVVYAPPGSSSSVTYGSSSSVGSSDSVMQSSGTSTVINTSANLGGQFFGFGAKTTITASDGWSTLKSGTDGISVQTTQGNSIATLGPISSSLGVNHDNDVIYILLNPMLVASVDSDPALQTITSITWTSFNSNSCDLSALSDTPDLYQQINGCDPNQYPFPDIIGIPVWCLKNPYYPGRGCSQWLQYTARDWDHSYRGPASSSQSGAFPEDPTNPPGLTLQDYADILRADPFVALNKQQMNVCHSTYGPNLDPNDSETVPSTPPANGTLVSTLVTSGGSYSGTPTVVFTDPSGASGVGAAGTAVMSGSAVIGISITNNGIGYSAPPVVSFTGGGQASAAAALAYISTEPKSCGSAAQINRFQPYGTVEYPVPGPNGLPSTYAGTFTHTNTSTTQTTATDTHTTTFGIDVSQAGFSLDLGIAALDLTAGVGWNRTSVMTWQNSSESNTTSDYMANYSITGPQLSDNYSGPATYNVYLDNIYGTYAFYSNLEPRVNLGTIGVSPGALSPSLNNIAISAFTPAAVGTSTPQIVPITLTNNSAYPLTMVWPAVTFSDPGFQLVQNDGNYPDGCSNQYLLPYDPNQSSSVHTGYCTLYIEFLPQPSDAPNPDTGTNYPSLQAAMIAAGTENASSYQNILVTSQSSVIGAVTSVEQGATLMANDSSVTQINPEPNIYRINTAITTGAVETETFTFTDYYQNADGSSITLAALDPVTLSDNTNFSISSTNCAGPYTYGQHCTVTVQFQPTVLSAQDIDTYTTSITVSGTVGNSTVVIPLAYAGLEALAYPGIASPTSLALFSDSECYQGSGNSYCYVAGNAGDVTVTNPTNASMSLQVNLVSSTGTSFFYYSGDDFSDCTTHALAAHDSCDLHFNEPYGSGSPTDTNFLDNVYSVTVTGQPSYTTQFEIQETSYPYIPCDTNAGSCPWGDSISITVNPSSSSSTVIAGGTAQYTFNIAPGSNGYLNPVSFTATGLPAGATASFSPATLAANAGARTVTLSIQTAASHASLSQPKSWLHMSPILLGLLLLPLTAMRRLRRSPHQFVRLLTIVLLLATGIPVIGGVIGCGSGAGGAGSVPSHTYTITITATNGPSRQSITVPLIVIQ